MRSPLAPVRSAMSSRTAWIALAIFVVALIGIGQRHPSVETPAARITNLENIIKCPSCANASLSQSETVGANDLKRTISIWVHQGLTDSQIEARIVGEYGTGELLSPTNRAIWIVPAVVVFLALALVLLALWRRRAGTEAEARPEDLALVAQLLAERTPVEGVPGGTP